MLEHLNRKKVLRAKILVQNVLKTTNSTAKLYRGAVLRACFRHFLLCFHFLGNLEISTQESSAQPTEISIYKTQFLTIIVNKKGQEGSLSKHCSRNVLKWQILIDSSFHDQGVSLGHVFLILITKDSL